MDWSWVITAGLIGAAIGYFLPSIAYKVVEYKQKKKNKFVEKHLMDQIGVRIATALVNGSCWGLAIFYEDNLIIVGFVALFSLLAILFTIIDWRIHIVPNEMLLIMVACGILYQLIGFGWKALGVAILCMLVLMFVFTILGLIIGLHKIGAGDVKLVATMGLILGYPSVFTGILAMSVALLVFIFVGMLSGKLTHVSMFAFAPFMMFGMMVGLINGLIV